MTGTGKYPSLAAMQASLVSSACEIVTVAVRRVQTQAAGHEGLMEAIDWSRIWMLPNTAGCATAEEAIRVARLGRELAKLAGKYAENQKVAVRNVRRDANDDLKKAEKAGEISQDEQKKMEAEVQKDTDAAIKRIDEALKVKEVEIMQV